jgi:PPK2 family polyphosphate:nucleotide phosphotransferase
MGPDVERFRVREGRSVALSDIDPDEGGELDDGERDRVDARFADDLAQLFGLQERLYAERKQSLLVVLLAIDTGGKDSTIRHVVSGLNPQGVYVRGFGVPTAEELAHDFLWRIHPHVPAKGMIGIFNRSHYEDVTAAWIGGVIDDGDVPRRYEHIRAFERMLVDSNTHIVKLHLRISREEQAERLRDRVTDPEKHWKFNPKDLDVRKQWDAYQHAFEGAINATSTKQAPWYIVPANRKWYRDAIVARVLVNTLERMDPRFPPPIADIGQYQGVIL